MTHHHSLDDDVDPPELDELADLTPGSAVGPYVILDRLGRGGMGQVFLAHDSRLRRKVALKCLLVQRNARRDVRSQVLREARAAARISHPNVAAVYDVIEHGTRIFIVMEYVDGESLAARLKRERLPIDTVIAIGRQLASGLGAAHARGIVHRDLKPANIQLALDGSVKVVDFGVAKAVAMPTTVTTLTGDVTDIAVRGSQPGTPGYMSPEQLLGRDTEPRSDTFCLGVVLFELATGQRLFTNTDPVHVIAAIAKPLPRADAIDPKVPRELSDIIAKALETDPGQRIQSAAEFESALAELDQLHGATTMRDGVARPSSTPVAAAGVGVHDLRGRLILSHSQPELLRLKYEVEQYLATQPHDVDGRVLRDDVDRAIGAGLSSSRGRRQALPGMTYPGIALLVIGAALGMFLYRSTQRTSAPPPLVVEAPKSSTPVTDRPNVVVPPARTVEQHLEDARRLLTSDEPERALRGPIADVLAVDPNNSLALDMRQAAERSIRLTAFSRANAGAGGTPRPATSAPAPQLVVPAGRLISLELSSPLSSETTKVGERVEARVTQDVSVGSQVAIPAGTRVIGTVWLVDKGDGVKEAARLEVTFLSLILGNTLVSLPDDQLTAAALDWRIGTGGAIKGGTDVRLPAGAQARIKLPVDVPIPIKK